MKVVALETGYDNIALRNPGDIFDMPDNVFERRPKLNADGEPIKGVFHEPPHWFEPVDAGEKSKVESERKAIRKTAGIPAVDPARQQGAQLAEHHLRAAAQAQVEQEDVAADDAEKNKRVEARLADLRKAAGLKVPETDKPEPFKGTPAPSPENLERSNSPHSSSTQATTQATTHPKK